MKQKYQNLESQFMSLGFSNYREMIDKADFEDDFIFMRTQVKATHPKELSTYGIDFLFMVRRSKGDCPDHIVLIHASLVNPINERLPKCVAEYRPKDEPQLPSKNSIIARVFEISDVERIRQKFHYVRISPLKTQEYENDLTQRGRGISRN